MGNPSAGPWTGPQSPVPIKEMSAVRFASAMNVPRNRNGCGGALLEQAQVGHHRADRLILGFEILRKLAAAEVARREIVILQERFPFGRFDDCGQRFVPER